MKKLLASPTRISPAPDFKTRQISHERFYPMSSKKCQQCGLINFATDEKCKRCQSDLRMQVAQPDSAPNAVPTLNANLTPCLDCGFHHSRQAEACPQCGRFIQRIHAPDSSKGAGSLALLSAFLILVAMVLGFAGLVTLYSPERIVGGDAFNYIIAGSRGTGLLLLGVGILILAAQLDIRSEIVKSRKY